jgi:predicted DNA-binding antitoxin AbrB/MazE fold protein
MLDPLLKTFYKGSRTQLAHFTMPTLLTKGAKMAREFRARFSKGKIEPLEKVDLREGEEFAITNREEKPSQGSFERAAGGWKDLVDTDALFAGLQGEPEAQSS